MALQHLSQHSQHQSTARIRVPSGPLGLTEQGFIPGMWITADFRLYPPVITANQELVSPTGDHRYRGGTERAHPRGFRV